MAPRHLVLPSGGPDGLVIYGIVQGLVDAGALDVSALESIHSVSVGAIVAVLLALKHAPEVVRAYMVMRPWEKVFSIDAVDLPRTLDRRGIFDAELIAEIVRPMLEASGLSTETTLEALHAYTGVTIHMYTVDANRPDGPIGLSHLSHPSLAIGEALMRSCCMPVVFAPVLRGEACYVDGAIMVKCPLQMCIDSLGDEYDAASVLVIRGAPMVRAAVGGATNLFEYIMHLIMTLNRRSIREYECSAEGVPTIYYSNHDVDPWNWYLCIHSREKREEYVLRGREIAGVYTRR